MILPAAPVASRCISRSGSSSTTVYSAGPATPQTDLATANRIDFLRNAGVATVSVVAGFGLYPGTSGAEVVTDDVVGFKFEVRRNHARVPRTSRLLSVPGSASQ